MKLTRVTAALLGGSFLCSTGALAQPAPPPAAPPQAAMSSTLGEVVVTARRREERIQDVPVAVTALSGAQLARQNIVGVQDLTRTAPSLVITESPGSGRNMLQFSLRGQRQGDNLPSVDPSVGTYVGDQLFKRTYGMGNLMFDLASVEVLKGPQGTLFGLNTTGGNIIFRPNLPNEDSFQTAIKGQVGNYGEHLVEGYVNMPLSPNAALRVAGQYLHRNSYVTNVDNPGFHYGSQDGGALRATFRFNPTDRFESIVTGSWASSSGGGTPFKLRYVQAGSVADVLYNQQCGGACPVFPRGFLNQQLAINQALPFHSLAAGALLGFPAPSPFSNLDYAWNLANTTSWKLNDQITLKNIIGVRAYKSEGFNDVDASLAPLLEYGFVPKGREFSEEFQVLGSMPGFNWIVGAYYFRENVKSGSAPTGLPAESVNIASPFADSFQNPYDPIDNDINTSKSVFASGTKQLFHDISLTAGARYTWDTRETNFGTIYNIGVAPGQPTILGVPSQGQHCAFNPATDPGISAPQFHFNPTTCLIDVSHDFSRLTYTVSADWKPAPGKLLYVAHRLGYRAGAWSTRAIVSQGVTITAPEIVRDYEVGAKLDWHPGDTFLRTNIAAYHQDYSNIQRLVPFQLGFTTGTNFVNAQKATINGVEGEVSFEPVRGLQLSAFTAYTDAHFNKFLYPSVLGGPLDTDITKVAEFGGVSRWQAGGTVSVDLPTPETIGRGHFTASYYFQSSYWLQDNTTRSPDDKTPSYNLVNARLELNHIAGSKVSAALFATNLLNRNYVSARYVLVNSVGFMSDIVGEPRFYGFELSYNY